MQEARIRIKIDSKEAKREIESLGDDVSRIEKDARSRVGKGREKEAGGGRGGLKPPPGGRALGFAKAAGTVAAVAGGAILTAEAITNLTPVIQGIVKRTVGPLGDVINKLLGIPAGVIEFGRSEAGGRISAAMESFESLKALAELGVGADAEEMGQIGGMFRKAATAQSRFDAMIRKERKALLVGQFDTTAVLDTLIGVAGMEDLKKAIADEVLSALKSGMSVLPGR